LFCSQFLAIIRFKAVSNFGSYLPYSQALAFCVLPFLAQLVPIIRLETAIITCFSTLYNLNVSFASETDKYSYLAAG